MYLFPLSWFTLDSRGRGRGGLRRWGSHLYSTVGGESSNIRGELHVGHL